MAAMSARERRLARNESLFREVNEAVKTLPKGDSNGELQEFFCECADVMCTIRVQLTSSEYETARADGACFILIPGHEQPDVERVLKATKRYLLVEKVGDAEDEAEKRDPRDT
jgi:hypothetical protein